MKLPRTSIRPSHRFWWPAALLLLALLVACGEAEEPATPTPEMTFVPYENVGLGLTLAYPEAWITHESISGLTIASDQAVIDMESLSEVGDTGFVVVIPGEIDVFNFQTDQSLTSDDALPALNVYKRLLEREGQTFTTLEPPRGLVIDGQQSAVIVLESEQEGETLITEMAVVMGDQYMALVSAVSLADAAEQHRPIFDRVISSIHISPPVTASG